MEKEKAKALQFIGRLMQNPSLEGFTALQREDQLFQFFDVNAEKLKPTLSSPAYFDGWSWLDIQKLMTATLYDITNKEILPQIQEEIFERTSYSYVTFLKLPPLEERGKRQLFEMIRKLLQIPVGRRGFAGTLTALRSGLLKRYVSSAFDRQKYIHFELTKVQRLRMPQEEIYNLLKTTMFIRPLTVLFDSSELMGQGFTKNHAEKVLRQLQRLLPGIPEEILKGGVNSGMAFQDDPKLEATSRLSAVFGARCSQLKQGMKIDRGAAASDQSWFSIARRNYKYYGYDCDLLTELYNISAENGW